jgi:sulfate/thiosulfate transport system substrate-binding protein
MTGENIERPITRNGWRRGVALALMVITAAALVYYGGRAIIAGRQAPVRLVVYGFSTQEEIFRSQIFPEFEKEWEAANEQDLLIEGFFGPSGTLATQIVLGAPADVAVFSNAQHVTWLQVGHRVRQDTQAEIFGCTPMVIVVRPDNPLHITDYADLARPGVELLHAEPGGSGAGDWAVLAEYGSAFLATGDNQAAREQLEATWENVAALGSSARAAMALFELGAGQALVTYEQDARLAQDRSVPLEIVVPARTILAQHVVVIVDDNVTRGERLAAEAFVRFLLGETGQSILARRQLRPPTGADNAFPPVTQTFTALELGGWSQAYREIIENLWKKEIASRLAIEGWPRFSYPSE